MNRDYYAYIDKADINRAQVFFEFHCLPLIEADAWLNLSREQFRNVLLENPIPVITLHSTLRRLHRYLRFPQNIEDMESDWYRLSTNRERNGARAGFYQDASDQDYLYISGIGPVDPETLEKLNFNTSIDDFGDAPKEKLSIALNQHGHRMDAEFVAVYNVGQGNCTAICDERGIPLLYMDLGGGCYQNKASYPATLRLCFTAKPVIILSHWDTDHYETAKREPAYLENKTWIVPRQKFGPVHKKFFLSLQRAGTVLIWPQGLITLDTSFGPVFKCGSFYTSGKNHTGLAMDVSLSPRRNTIRHVLLPADAAYTYIPLPSDYACDGLVATHHGAKFERGNAPVPLSRGKGAIAYSYGNPNTYRHPKRAAVTAHLHRKRRDTKNGHIALSDQPCRPQPCGGGCSLQPTQNYQRKTISAQRLFRLFQK